MYFIHSRVKQLTDDKQNALLNLHRNNSIRVKLLNGLIHDYRLYKIKRDFDFIYHI